MATWVRYYYLQYLKLTETRNSTTPILHTRWPMYGSLGSYLWHKTNKRIRSLPYGPPTCFWPESTQDGSFLSSNWDGRLLHSASQLWRSRRICMHWEPLSQSSRRVTTQLSSTFVALGIRNKNWLADWPLSTSQRLSGPCSRVTSRRPHILA